MFKKLVSKFLVGIMVLTSVLVPKHISFAKSTDVNLNAIYNQDNYEHEFAPGRVIVGLKDGTTGIVNTDLAKDIDIKSIRKLGNAKSPNADETSDKVYAKEDQTSNLYLVSINGKEKDDVIKAIEELKNNDNVEYAEPDYKITVNTVPNDPSYSSQWGLPKISAPKAWDSFTGSSSVVVGIIDTGIDYTHTDLTDNIWVNPGEIANDGIDNDNNGFIDDVHGWDFANDDSDPYDDNGHGTHVAGIIAGEGNNSIGISGVAWQTKLVGLKFLAADGSGYTSDAIDAVNYANAMGISITNNSWGGGGYSQALYNAIAAGGLFIAAAGNEGTNNDSTASYPASFTLSNIISVAATTSTDSLASFSNYGATSVDIAAPGYNIYSTYKGNTYKNLSGTSMATPFVTGAAALAKGKNPSLTTAQIKSAILNGADYVSSLKSKVVTAGRLNVYNAIQ